MTCTFTLAPSPHRHQSYAGSAFNLTCAGSDVLCSSVSHHNTSRSPTLSHQEHQLKHSTTPFTPSLLSNLKHRHPKLFPTLTTTTPPKKRARTSAPDSNPVQDALKTLSDTIANLEKRIRVEEQENEELGVELSQAQDRSQIFAQEFKRKRERAEKLNNELKESTERGAKLENELKEEKQRVARLETQLAAKGDAAAKERASLEKKYAELLGAAQGVIRSNALGLGQRIGELNHAVGELQNKTARRRTTI